MKFKKTEKEIIKSIIKYGNEKSLADVINKSHLLEKRGIAIVPYHEHNYIFLRKDIYDDWYDKEALGYIAELLSLVDFLIKKRYIILIPGGYSEALVIGAQDARWHKNETLAVNGNEHICLAERYVNWFDANGNQKYWDCHFEEQQLPISKLLMPWFSISQELKTLVKNDFKSEDEIRFRKQQCLTWISIGVATLIGILGIIF